MFEIADFNLFALFRHVTMYTGDKMTDLLLIVIIALLAGQADLFKENISVAAAKPPLRLIAIIAISIAAIYLFIRYIPLVKRMEHKKAKYLLYISLASMIGGMFVPYYKLSHPLISSLHLALTLFSVISLFCFQLAFMAELRIKNVRQFNKVSRIMLIYMWVVSMIILTFNAINGLCEIITLAYLLLFVRMNR